MRWLPLLQRVDLFSEIYCICYDFLLVWGSVSDRVYIFDHNRDATVLVD